MTTLAIRKKLADYMQVADDKKVKTMYALLEDDIAQEILEYTPALKKTLDEGQAYYKSGAKLLVLLRPIKPSIKYCKKARLNELPAPLYARHLQ